MLSPVAGKEKAVIHGTTDRALSQDKRTDVAGNGGWIYNRTTAHTAQERVSPTPCAVGWGPHRERAETACHSPEGPRCQAGRWHPVLPACLGGPGVLLVPPLREAPDRLQAPSGQAPRGYPPRTKAQGDTPGLNTSLLSIDTILIFRLWGLLHSVHSEVRISQCRHTVPHNSTVS